MTRARKIRKVMLSVTAVLAGGTVLNNGCINTLASIPVCGTVLTFCTPVDQLNLMFPLLQTPDYATDPSCTIPLGCGGGDIYQNIPDGFPGGSPPLEPQDESEGLGGGGGGGGGI